MSAAACGQAATAELLIASGARIDARTSAGLSPLWFAVFEGHEDVARLLIERGADTALKDESGRTLVDIARARGHVALADYLSRTHVGARPSKVQRSLTSNPAGSPFRSP
jgi:ankyrin repeat protein